MITLKDYQVRVLDSLRKYFRRCAKGDDPGLNCSYAFSVAPNIGDVLHELRGALESNGFTKAEAERGIALGTQLSLPYGMQQRLVAIAPAEIDVAATTVQAAALAGKVRFNAATHEITVLMPLDSAEKRAVGAVWASRSGGRGLFVMPTDCHFAEIATAIHNAVSPCQ